MYIRMLCSAQERIEIWSIKPTPHALILQHHWFTPKKGHALGDHEEADVTAAHESMQLPRTWHLKAWQALCRAERPVT